MISAFEAFKFGKFGPKIDPRGAHIVTNAGRLLEITGARYQEFGAPGFMFATKHLNGETGPDLPTAAFKVLVRE